MSLDLYYSGFRSVGVNLEKFYSKFLDEHDNIEQDRNRMRHAAMEAKKDMKPDEPSNSSYTLRNLKKDFEGLKTNGGGGGGQEEHRKINREYLNRPLKANDRLKYFQNSNSELGKDARRFDRADEMMGTSRNRVLKESTSEICLSQTNSFNNNQSDRNDNQSTSMSTSAIAAPTLSTNRPALLTISTNCQDAPNNAECIASPAESHESAPQSTHPKLENFNWFEAVEREEIPDFTPNLNNSGGSNNKFDTLSVASYSSNPASPQDRISPQSQHTNRSRRNSLNRFRSDIYRQSNEDLHQNDNKRTNRNDSKQSQQNYHQSWRNTGRNSPRNDPRNGYNNKRGGEYDRENSNNNGRHNDGGGGGGGGGVGGGGVGGSGGNYNNRRNLIRGGSVDSKGKDFNTRTRDRHDSFNRRNQENDNFEHFQSYNRKTYSRNKDNFMNNRTLPPRLQQKWQQQRSDYNNDCDNPKRFNNRNNQSGAGNTNKGNTIAISEFKPK